MTEPLSVRPERTLPHRAPFLWVTRLMERREDGLQGKVELDVPSELEVFRGHFPGQPVFPGVLQMEGAAQACLWVLLGELPEGASLPEVLFVAVDSYKFRRPVVPPGTLEFAVERRNVKAGLQLWDVSVSYRQGADLKLVSQGSFWLRMVPKSS